ncbi:glycosyltransferase family 4 protein [Spirulina sp. CS-785/01]|uniref:glycosyltransferase family 4 protein n=1 Tax=Spirulina sp. CS-785/01 TaxID=3021716 RepID=UPI00232EDE0A|nr:glycosyltransferase family 4 protein [Spirulina sp. CS-785/01]MDB9311795.1 glycosyltransferase family 4 protein [Spirulina sp. CS-785/01]
MKILSISNCPLNESQGSGYVVVNFSQRLRQFGHEVDNFAPDDYEPLQFLRGRANNYRLALGMLPFTLQKLQQKSYDIIEFYGADAWFTIYVLSRFWKNKYLLVHHSNGIENQFNAVLKQYSQLQDTSQKWYQLDQSLLFQYAFREVQGIITQSDYDRHYALQQNYQDADHVLTIPSGLSKDYLGLNVDFTRPPVIGYCGSWIARKGIKTIQQDIPQILQDFPDSQLVLIGVGEDFRIADYFPTTVQSQIKVIPFVANKQELAQLYQTLSIVIVPSLYESFGLVTAEAMACGCAVVASRVGYAVGRQHQEEIYLLDSPTSPYLYEAVKTLLANETLRLKIAQHGYQAVQGLTWENAIARLEQVYQHWLKQQ